MFEDFASSGKGPGLVGILLAFLVLAGFSGMAIAVYYDDGSAGAPTLQAKVSSNKTDIQLKKETLISMEEKLAKYNDFQKLTLEVTANERRIKQSNEEFADLEKKKAAALEAVEAEKRAFEQYRQQYRITERGTAVGEKIDLSETKGADFNNVEILGISATLFRVRSSSGPKGIPYQELPPAIQDRFQFSEDEAADYNAKLAQLNKVQNKRIAAFQKVQDAKMADRKAANRVARIKYLNAEIQKLTDIAAKKRDLSRDYDSKAKQHLSADKAARTAGKMSMHKGLARADASKSRRYANEAVQAQQEADKLGDELERISN